MIFQMIKYVIVSKKLSYLKNAGCHKSLELQISSIIPNFLTFS